MMRCLPLWMLGVAFVVPGVGWAMDVVNGTQGLEINGKKDVTVFMPTPREVWVVAPGETRGAVAARNGWTVEWLQAEGAGLRLVSPAARSWEVVKNKDTFTVRMGRGGKTAGVVQDSLIILKNNEIIGPKGQPVASADGRRFWVNARGAWAVGAGVGQVLSGGVIGAEDNLSLGLADIEPASGGGDVPLTATAALPGVDSPVGGAAVVGEDLRAPGLVTGAIYTPGEVVLFTLPAGYRLVDGEVVRDGASKAAMETVLAVEEAAERVAGIEKVGPAAKPEVAPAAVATPVEVHAEVGHEETARAPAAEEAPADAEHGATEGEHSAAVVAHGDEVSATHSAEEGVPAHHAEVTKEAVPGWLPEPVSNRAFKPAETALQHEIVNAKDMPAAMAKRRELARFYLANQRAEEALGVMALVAPAQPQDELLAGVARTVQARSVEGVKVLGGVSKGLWKSHADMWRATALSGAGRYAEALQVWPREKGLLAQYPNWMRDRILLARAEALLAVGGKREAGMFVADVTKNMDGGSPAWQRLEGLSLIGTKEDARGLELLAEAAEQTRDPATAYRAKYEFLNTLLAKDEIEPRQMVTYLEDLRMDWRGDTLEQEVLRQLGQLYVRRDDYREGLQRWQTLLRAYPKYPGMGQLTREMTGAVMGAFDPENPVGYTPLEFIGLFYDFRELLPTDARGDRITERVGQLLSEATLYERAISLLENLLRYRTPEAPIDRARIALQLARAQRLRDAPQESLKLLDDYNKDVSNAALRESWQIERGKTLVALDRPQLATEAVAGILTMAADTVRMDAAWQAQDWLGVAKAAETVLDEPLVDPQSPVFKVALLRAAFADLMLGQGGRIADLQKKFALPLKDMPEVGDSVRAMAGMQGVDLQSVGSEGPLGRFANTLAEINQLAMSMQAMRRAQEATKQEQEEYNQKMRYMELLPPPVL